MSVGGKYNWMGTRPWVYHSLFWLCYYLYGALVSLTIHQMYDSRFYAELVTLMGPDMLLVYVNIYLLRPAFLPKRSYTLYLLTVFLCMSATSALNIILHHLYALAGSSFFAASGVFSVPTFATQLLNSAYLLFVTGSLKFFKDWFLQQQQLKEKERQQIALELKFLKAQVHPHFFFNTLNNLYSLTLRKSDLAPEVVLKLSSLMSYMLYESGVSMVPLGKEIAHLEDYIALERLRFGDRLALTFRKDDAPMHDAPMHDAPTDDAPTDDAPMDDAAMEAIRIPPLLLITFVENSFKHGIGQSIGDGSIDISLHREQHHLVFSISNSVGELVTQPLGDDVSQEVHPFSRTSPMANQPLHTPVANGLGLKNAIRRLDLLYGSRYRIDRNQSDGHYHVTLKIPLA